MEGLRSSITTLFEQNRRVMGEHQYTVPSPELYPFQWLWDSCFHAIILSHFDLAAAKCELRAVLSHPLPSGLLPHIIFWQDDSHITNWGREMRGDIINGAWQTEGVSSLTQPPVVAYALWRVFEVDHDVTLLEDLYPTLVRHFACIDEDRTFNGDSLAYIINPDESGEDNSPRFDLAQNLQPVHSANESLDWRIELIRKNATCKFNAKTCMSKFFGIADVPFNVLYAQDLRAMHDIATAVGDHDGATHYLNTSEAVRREAKEQLRCGDLFCAYDHIRGEHITTLTWAIFMPLYGELLEAHEAKHLVEQYLCNGDLFQVPFMIPTTAISEPSYDPNGGFWRGPVWIAPNWFIYHGLKKYGYDEVAHDVYTATKNLIEKSGFREQYHPHTGEGQGAHDFTWGGLILDMQ